MLWRLHIDEGSPYDVLVRAAQLALSLAEQDDVRLVRDASQRLPAWTRLLSPVQRDRLARLSNSDDAAGEALRHVQAVRENEASDAEARRGASAALAAAQGHVVQCCVGGGVQQDSSACAWLVVLAEAECASPQPASPGGPV